MNYRAIFKKNDVQSLIERNAIKEYENRPDNYYTSLQNLQITFDRLNQFKEKLVDLYEQDIQPFFSNNFFYIETHDPIDNQRLQDPARGRACDHFECINLKSLIREVAITG
jgi:hypothetical protein